MKHLSHKLLCAFLVCILAMGTFTKTKAQQKLIHYWNFNNFKGLSAAGSPSLITPLHANWSSIDSTKAIMSYVPSTSVSSKYLTYWDVVAGEASDTFNHINGPTGTAAGNYELRVRNPSDSMELLFALPTTKYKNITIKYGAERTTSGQGKELFDYSTDGGKTWKTPATKSDTILPVFSLVSLDFSSDTTVNNNPSNFIFRVKFTTPNSTSSGNNRIDNVTVSGDTDKIKGGITPPPPGQKLIHYWNFNNFVGLSAAGSPSLILPLHANWSSIDSTKALISYVPSTTVSAKYLTYWDAVAGEASDTFNYVNGPTGIAAGNNELRVRNPSDSMELLFKLPTTKYKNINIKFSAERTTSGPGREFYDYSTDGGTNWKTLGTKSDTILPVFSLISLDFSGDTTVNNNATGFIFRVKLGVPNSPSNGNNRFDNVTVMGDTDEVTGHSTGINTEVTNESNYKLYPNPANNQVIIATGSENGKTISIFNLNGKLITRTLTNDSNILMDISSFTNGMYIVHVIENETGKSEYLRLVKN